MSESTERYDGKIGEGGIPAPPAADGNHAYTPPPGHEGGASVIYSVDNPKHDADLTEGERRARINQLPALTDDDNYSPLASPNYAIRRLVETYAEHIDTLNTHAAAGWESNSIALAKGALEQASIYCQRAHLNRYPLNDPPPAPDIRNPGDRRR